jgi:sugar phosphate isomerase/epimerase
MINLHTTHQEVNMKQQSIMNRRTFNKSIILSAGLFISDNSLFGQKRSTTDHPIRLGGPVFPKKVSPDEWIQILKRNGYSAAKCPVKPEDQDDLIRSYEQAAKKANIVIAEVGAFGVNPIHEDETERQKAISHCIARLELAEKIDANCCVNCGGSRSTENWYGAHPNNFTRETFEMIVEATRKIIDAVKPTRTFYTIETMPYQYPDSIESYLNLIKAIDRKAFAVHFDPVNLICSPQRYYNNDQIIREFFSKLGPYVRSCHAKDILLSDDLTTHLDEVVPGRGFLNYSTYLSELAKLKDIPLMMEHMQQDEYPLAAAYIRSIGSQSGLKFH